MKRITKSSIVLLCLFVAVGCAGSKITKAYNTVNSVRDFYNGLPPIYDAVIKANPDTKESVEAFDAEMNKAIQSAYDAIIAAKAGTGTLDDYETAKAHIVEIINRYGGEKWMSDPSIQSAITVLESLLGVKK